MIYEPKLKCQIYLGFAWDNPLTQTVRISRTGNIAIYGIANIRRRITDVTQISNAVNQMAQDTDVYEVPLSSSATALLLGAFST